MANLIDSLLVALSLDARAFKKGATEVQDETKKIGKEAEKAQKVLDEQAAKMADSLARVSEAAIGLTVAFVGAFAGHEYVEKITRTDAAVGRLSKNLGMGAEQLSKWQNMGQRIAGTGPDEVTGMFQTFIKWSEEIKNFGGSDDLNFLAARGGLDIGKWISSDMEHRALQVAAAMEKLNRQDAIFFGQKAGLSESQMDLILRVSAAELARQEQIGYVTTKQTQQAQERNKIWTEFDQTLDNIGHKITETVWSPISESMGRSLNKDLHEHAMGVAGDGLVVGGMIAWLSGLTLSAAAPMAGVLGGAAAAIGLMATNAGIVVAALGSGLAIGTLLDKAMADILTAATGRETDLGGWLFDKFDNNDYTSPRPKGTRRSDGSIVGNGNLNDAVAHQESGNRDYNADGSPVRSPRGAMYAMQVLPSTARDPGHGIKPAADGSPAEFNRVGRELLTALLRDFGGDMRKALASYNWGEGNVLKYGMDHLPPETAGYVHNIMATMNSAKPPTAWAPGGSSVNVGDVHIHTTASDGAGIARDFRRSLSNLTLAGQANTGLN